MKKQTIHSEMSSWNISFKHSPWSVALGSMFVLFLSACGSDSGSSGPSDNVASESDIIEATFDDLPVCTDKREGVTAYVKEEKTAYTCIDGDWIPESDSDETQNSSSSRHCEDCKDEAILSSSMDKAMSSSSGNEEKSSSSEIASSSSLNNEQNSSAIEGTDEVAIKDKSISGVSQKGPFVTGSTVKLYELDGKTYAQTGKSFTGKITTDDGKFSVSSVTLASQYALFEANGYFRNEITGGKSKGTVTLNALTDLTDRKTVNINLLTHLEYERALYLVNSGIDIPSAKKQAETEILKAFEIKGEFANSEDLDIFSMGDGNAALLAFSVLMLRDLSEADLTELLTKFATDIEKDGSWDDWATKAKIADWVATKDCNGGLTSIRSKIEKWNLGMVPEFEKYVRNFWYTNYGLGECGSNNKTEVLATKNERSTKYGTQTRYICKNGAWVEATDLEKDFYKSGKDNGDDGEIWTGLVTGTKYKYDEAQKKWLVATKNDTTLNLMGCTISRADEVVKSPYDDTYYVCKNMDWQKAQEIDYDTYGEKCSSADVGKRIDGVVIATNKYYCTANGWVSLMGGWSWDVPKEARLNPDIAYGTMIDVRDNKVYKTIKIGMQVWMAENLNYYDSTLDGRSWCVSAKSSATTELCAVTGRLYTWAAAIDSVKLATDADNPQVCGSGKTCTLPAKVQGICPDSWHLPIKSEWETLITEVGGILTAGKVLKSQTGWDDDVNGTDEYGFSVLPVGYRASFGSFFSTAHSFTPSAYFWSVTEYNNNAYDMEIGCCGESASLDYDSKDKGYSVRCLRD